MKSLHEIMNKEINESKTLVSKGIYSQEGRKVNLARTGKNVLSLVYSDDTIENVTWLQYKKANVKSTSSANQEKAFVMGLMGQIKQFGKKVDVNTQLRSVKSFEDRVDLILNNGVKYNKSGMKS